MSYRNKRNNEKILTVVGARPHFIKASVVSRAMAQTPGLAEVLVHTGQHFDANISDVFFTQLGIPRPHHLLDIYGGGHGEMTGRMLIEIERILLQEQPDRVLVYGDTNSTLAGADADAIAAAARAQIGQAVTDEGRLYGGGVAAQRVAQVLAAG